MIQSARRQEDGRLWFCHLDVWSDSMTTRKLIRPNLTEIKERLSQNRSNARRKAVPPEQTSAEAFYYLKQMSAKTPMVIVLNDGEELRGVIEWYDKSAIKVNRVGAPNLLVMKLAVKYMYKAEEAMGTRDEIRHVSSAPPLEERG
jgi:host factor-I protein